MEPDDTTEIETRALIERIEQMAQDQGWRSGCITVLPGLYAYANTTSRQWPTCPSCGFQGRPAFYPEKVQCTKCDCLLGVRQKGSTYRKMDVLRDFGDIGPEPPRTWQQVSKRITRSMAVQGVRPRRWGVG